MMFVKFHFEHEIKYGTLVILFCKINHSSKLKIKPILIRHVDLLKVSKITKANNWRIYSTTEIPNFEVLFNVQQLRF